MTRAPSVPTVTGRQVLLEILELLQRSVPRLFYDDPLRERLAELTREMGQGMDHPAVRGV